MKLSTTRTTLALVAFIMFAGFQNCSKVNFASSEDAALKGQGTGLEDQDFPIDEELDPNLVVTTPTPAPSATPGPIGDGGDDGEDQVADMTSCEQFALSQQTGITGVNVRIRKHRGDLLISDSKTLELSNIRGSVMAKTDAAKHLRNMRGSLCLVGDSLDHLNNHRGNIEIIGATSSFINNTRGTLIINGGSVGRISNHRGNIILRNGATVGDLDNVRGDVIDESSSTVASAQ